MFPRIDFDPATKLYAYSTLKLETVVQLLISCTSVELAASHECFAPWVIQLCKTYPYTIKQIKEAY